MSGGHWDHSGFRIQMALEDIAADEQVQRRFPNLGKVLDALASVLYDIEHDLDWAFSSDTSIDDDSKFENDALMAILHPVLTHAPDAWFTRGKWATIQAIQDRKDPQSL